MRMRTASILDKVFVFVGTLCLAGNQYKVPSVEFWQSIMQSRSYLVIVSLSIVGIFGAFTPFSSWATLKQVDRSVTVQTQMLSNFGKLIGRNRFIGCVSVNASRGFTSLDTDELWSELNRMCLRIRQTGFDGT
ncbi:MAG: hypothetical protein ACRDRE_10010 [Pseudonocardiaceae bacterium]